MGQKSAEELKVREIMPAIILKTCSKVKDTKFNVTCVIKVVC